ncbi:hypothetical protein PV328_008300 [Microctonus aethiopoides]|uniref:Uncharacterized protein n=1 Tax=Microctonus aethiopoides TaxID=144406 RepID=A0AA39EZQ8_9HYME|nr:hypothetical protein PV328_008300 [Microctonus aethiopoides]
MVVAKQQQQQQQLRGLPRTYNQAIDNERDPAETTAGDQGQIYLHKDLGKMKFLLLLDQDKESPTRRSKGLPLYYNVWQLNETRASKGGKMRPTFDVASNGGHQGTCAV